MTTSPETHRYRVLIRGENFLVNLDGRPHKLGFYTTRFVAAGNPATAERLAVELIRQELRDMVLNPRDDNPMLYLDEIGEVASFDGFAVPGTGFAWFTEED